MHCFIRVIPDICKKVIIYEKYNLAINFGPLGITGKYLSERLRPLKASSRSVFCFSCTLSHHPVSNKPKKAPK